MVATALRRVTPVLSRRLRGVYYGAFNGAPVQTLGYASLLWKQERLILL